MSEEKAQIEEQSGEPGELEQRVVSIKRTSKVLKGGRSFHLSALVAVGDYNGHVGIGLGKAKQVPDAIRKGEEAARKALIRVPMKGTTIPHEVTARFTAGQVIMRPASEGTGVIAGETMRAVLELAGIRDILAKSLGSDNPINVVKATMEGFQQLHTAEEMAAKRGLQSTA